MSVLNSLYSALFYRMPNHGFQLFRGGFARVRKVDFVVKAGWGEIVDVTFGGNEIIH